MGGNRVLVIGYGNPGRQDDGLGAAVIERLEALGLEGVTVDADYQLNIEDAADMRKRRIRGSRLARMSAGLDITKDAACSVLWAGAGVCAGVGAGGIGSASVSSDCSCGGAVGGGVG